MDTILVDSFTHEDTGRAVASAKIALVRRAASGDRLHDLEMVSASMIDPAHGVAARRTSFSSLSGSFMTLDETTLQTALACAEGAARGELLHETQRFAPAGKRELRVIDAAEARPPDPAGGKLTEWPPQFSDAANALWADAWCAATTAHCDEPQARDEQLRAIMPTKGELAMLVSLPQQGSARVLPARAASDRSPPRTL
jgi:hypothetical protein